MACKACARRATKLLGILGFTRQRVGPNRVTCWIYETQHMAVVIPTGSLRSLTTRASALALLARLLFGRSRASDAPTPTEVWVLPHRPSQQAQFVKETFWRPGDTVQAMKIDSKLEVRRAAWLRIVGPIDEQLQVVETGLMTDPL